MCKCVMEGCGSLSTVCAVETDQSLHQEFWTTVCPLAMPVGCIWIGDWIKDASIAQPHLTYSRSFNPLRFHINIAIVVLKGNKPKTH